MFCYPVTPHALIYVAEAKVPFSESKFAFFMRREKLIALYVYKCMPQFSNLLYTELLFHCAIRFKIRKKLF